jgi:murein DD-endopeptidase MepM/ murein hydrolase activator NlpD
MPYQPTHTGIDISDGWRSGVTPIHPFKPGRVIQVIHSNAGFGNHVIIDHGGGLTSLYGHMYSTSAQVGQQVDSSSILGYEGTTGASSGPHVHFEIRLNGQPVNPHNYVSGQP